MIKNGTYFNDVISEFLTNVYHENISSVSGIYQENAKLLLKFHFEFIKRTFSMI